MGSGRLLNLGIVCLGPLESACMFLHWARVFDILGEWAGSCELRFFPGDNPDAAITNKFPYRRNLSKML